MIGKSVIIMTRVKRIIRSTIRVRYGRGEVLLQQIFRDFFIGRRRGVIKMMNIIIIRRQSSSGELHVSIYQSIHRSLDNIANKLR